MTRKQLIMLLESNNDSCCGVTLYPLLRIVALSHSVKKSHLTKSSQAQIGLTPFVIRLLLCFDLWRYMYSVQVKSQLFKGIREMCVLTYNDMSVLNSCPGFDL